MTLKSISVALGLGLLLAGGGVMAQDAAGDQTPPVEAQSPAEQPAAEKTEDKVKCVTSTTAWREKGSSTTFEIELQNACDMKLKCTVDAFIIGARGQAQGHGTVVLAAAPKGQTTRNVYAVKVKSAGGMANISHSCKST